MEAPALDGHEGSGGEYRHLPFLVTSSRSGTRGGKERNQEKKRVHF